MVQLRVTAIPTYLDQVNPVTMSRSAPIHDAVFTHIRELGADHVRYLHWDPFALSYPLPGPPVHGKTTWDFTGIDPYVDDFMSASEGHDSVINFAPMYRWGVNESGFVDPTGVQAGEYFSRIISWYTKGGFVDELGAKHVSNHSYTWKYWEVLNEVDAGSSGTHCSSLNNSAMAPTCVKRYTDIYDGIVTVLHRDHPDLQFTGLVLAFPDCAGSEEWFRYFLNASNHRSPVREDFETYVSEVSYHFYSENSYGTIPSSLVVLEVGVFDSCSVQFKDERQGAVERAYLYARKDAMNRFSVGRNVDTCRGVHMYIYTHGRCSRAAWGLVRHRGQPFRRLRAVRAVRGKRAQDTKHRQETDAVGACLLQRNRHLNLGPAQRQRPVWGRQDLLVRVAPLSATTHDRAHTCPVI